MSDLVICPKCGSYVPYNRNGCHICGHLFWEPSPGHIILALAAVWGLIGAVGWALFWIF